MPFPHFHSCRMKDPGSFTRFVYKSDVNPNIVIGFKKGGGSEAQAFRYPKEKWTADAARKHCADKGGSFEAAKKGEEK